MAYRIAYDDSGISRESIKEKKGSFRGIPVLCISLLIIGAITVKNMWLPWVEDYLIPGDPAVTSAALEQMVQDLREGDSVGDAVAAFCREIVENADP